MPAGQRGNARFPLIDIVTKGFQRRQRAIVGGNCNNRAHYGAFYVNLNNPLSNANWNNGAALPYSLLEQKLNVVGFPLPLEKINSEQASVSSTSKADERIRQ